MLKNGNSFLRFTFSLVILTLIFSLLVSGIFTSVFTYAHRPSSLEELHPFEAIYPDSAHLDCIQLMDIIGQTVVLIEHDYGSSWGSGFVVCPTGLVITAAHVIRGSYRLTARFSTGESYAASIVNINNAADLALLKLQSPSKSFTSLSIGDEPAPYDGVASVLPRKEGYWVFTKGYITKTGKITENGWSTKVNHLVHTSHLNPGSSGSPLIDFYGHVVGVNIGITNAGFSALSTDYIKEILQAGYGDPTTEWESYWTESYEWHKDFLRAQTIFQKGLDAIPGSQDQADAWDESYKILYSLLYEVTFYDVFPFYRHVDQDYQLNYKFWRLPDYFTQKIEKWMTYYKLYITGPEDCSLILEDFKNAFREEAILAQEIYIDSFNDVKKELGGENPYKTACILATK